MSLSPEKKKKLRNDLILFGALLLVAAALWLCVSLFSKEGKYAAVTVDGEVIDRVPLSKDGEYRYETEGGFNVLVIRDGYADVTEADCPDKICVRAPKINRAGETVTCLPHRLVVTIEGGEEKPLDFTE